LAILLFETRISVTKKGISVVYADCSQCSFASMFKKLVSISLLLALIAPNFSNYFVAAGFETNKRYIANSLCENRTRPQLHCNGKCYLKKKFKQADERKKKQAEKNDREAYSLQRLCKFSFPAPPIEGVLSKRCSLYCLRYINHVTDRIFRPPRLLATVLSIILFRLPGFSKLTHGYSNSL